MHCKRVAWHQDLLTVGLAAAQALSRDRLFATPWTAARQASLFITSSRSLLKPMSSESVMSSNHLILCCSLLLLPSILPSIRVFSNKSALCIRWLKYGSWQSSNPDTPSTSRRGVQFPFLCMWAASVTCLLDSSMWWKDAA